MRFVSLLMLTVCATTWTGCGEQEFTRVKQPAGRISLPTRLVTAEFVERTGFAADHQKELGKVYGYFDAASTPLLTSEERDALVESPEGEITPDLYEGYHDYDTLTQELRRLETAHPDLIRLETAGKSVEGRELWYVVISDQVNTDEHEPKFIYHANMHGDEVVGRELMIYFIRHLMAENGRDPRITQLISHAEIFVMPSMNPDGFERGTRANARGYDLNRNFPDRFSSPTDSTSGRQIEVQHMMRLAADHHFVFGINWHGGEVCFNLPWDNQRNDSVADRHGDDAMFRPVGREYTQLNRPMYANHGGSFDHGLTYGYEWYPINGGVNDWFNHFRRSLQAIVELSVPKWPNSNLLDGLWNDNREAMVTYLWRGLRGVHLKVIDSDGNLITAPTVTLASAPLRPLNFDDGWVHRLTDDGPQRVTIGAPGFADKTVDTTARYFDGAFVTIQLDRP